MRAHTHAPITQRADSEDGNNLPLFNLSFSSIANTQQQQERDLSVERKKLKFKVRAPEVLGMLVSNNRKAES